MKILLNRSDLPQGHRKIFNLWVPSGKAEDQKSINKHHKLLAVATYAIADDQYT